MREVRLVAALWKRLEVVKRDPGHHPRRRVGLRFE